MDARYDYDIDILTAYLNELPPEQRAAWALNQLQNEVQNGSPALAPLHHPQHVVPDASRASTPGMMSADDEGMRQDLLSVPCTPGREKYRCDICKKYDHRIQFCPQRNPAPLTPYQGPNLSQGDFICWWCTYCYQAYVYANQCSACPWCGVFNLPRVMHPLPAEIRAVPQHDAHGYGEGDGGAPV